MKKKITIFDYGYGNVTSLKNIIVNLGYDVKLFSKNKKNIDILIIPGVGSFSQAMITIKKKKYDKYLKEILKSDTKIIGICLGMQILLSIGYEDKKTKGLNFINGVVKKINFEKKLPLVGFFPVKFKKNFFGLNKFNNFKFYHLHAFECRSVEDKNILGYTYYKNRKYISAIFSKNVLGFQFHPEKSKKAGLLLFKKLLNQI